MAILMTAWVEVSRGLNRKSDELFTDGFTGAIE